MSSQIEARQANTLDQNVENVRLQASEVVKTANSVKDIADEIVSGAASQVISLNAALERSNQLTTSLKESADQTSSIISSVEEIGAAINESATSMKTQRPSKKPQPLSRK
jgi:ABC-type transporter Mla subunit MlaD